MPQAGSVFDHHVHAVSGWIDFAAGNPSGVRIGSILPLMLIGGLLSSPMTKYRQNGQACDAPSALGAGVLSRHDAVWSAFLLAWLPFAWGLGLFRPSWLTSKAWQSILIAWLPACGVGLLIRSLAFGQSFAPTFALVSLVTSSGLAKGVQNMAGLLVRGRPPWVTAS